jgi:hypothetical protein
VRERSTTVALHLLRRLLRRELASTASTQRSARGQ